MLKFLFAQLEQTSGFYKHEEGGFAQWLLIHQSLTPLLGCTRVRGEIEGNILDRDELPGLSWAL